MFLLSSLATVPNVNIITGSGVMTISFYKSLTRNQKYPRLRFAQYLETDTSKEYRSSPTEVFSRKGVLKIYSKLTGENPCWSVISIKFLGCSPVILTHVFRTPSLKNTSYGLFLNSQIGKVSWLASAFFVGVFLWKKNIFTLKHQMNQWPRFLFNIIQKILLNFPEKKLYH